MRPDELLLALHDLGITLAPHGERLHVDAPKGVVTIAMAAALKEHKPLLLAVFRTFDDRARDADWDVVRAWLIDDTAKTFTKPMLARAKLVLPVGADEWPEAYARRYRAALQMRGCCGRSITRRSQRAHGRRRDDVISPGFPSLPASRHDDRAGRRGTTR